MHIYICIWSHIWLQLLSQLNDEGYVFISVDLFVSLHVSNITERCVNWFLWNFQNWSNMEHSWTFFDRLFHAGLDCFTFLKLGMLEACTLRVLLAIQVFTLNSWQASVTRQDVITIRGVMIAWPWYDTYLDMCLTIRSISWYIIYMLFYNHLKYFNSNLSMIEYIIQKR